MTLLHVYEKFIFTVEAGDAGGTHGSDCSERL